MESTSQPPLFELREVYEAQQPEVLLGMKAVHLTVIQERSEHLSIINGVLDGYGREIASEGFYDAHDGTFGPPERPEDNKWVVGGNK